MLSLPGSTVRISWVFIDEEVNRNFGELFYFSQCNAGNPQKLEVHHNTGKNQEMEALKKFTQNFNANCENLEQLLFCCRS